MTEEGIVHMFSRFKRHKTKRKSANDATNSFSNRSAYILRIIKDQARGQ